MITACAFFCAQKQEMEFPSRGGFPEKIDAADYLNAFLTLKIPRNLSLAPYIYENKKIKHPKTHTKNTEQKEAKKRRK